MSPIVLPICFFKTERVDGINELIFARKLLPALFVNCIENLRILTHCHFKRQPVTVEASESVIIETYFDLGR